MAFRAVHVTLKNQTMERQALILARSELEHGQWVIEPNDLVGDEDEWESESSDFSIGTGTEGRVTFNAGGVFVVRMHWNNPAIGRNTFDASVDPPGRSDGSGFSVGFFGRDRFNKEDTARVTFVVVRGKATIDEETGQVFSRPTPIWRHSVPGAGRPAVAPGTSLTSWYNTPENVQHIAYVDVDRQIRQCFFFIGGFGGWRNEVANTSPVHVASGTSPTSWYSSLERVQHIAYVGEDQLIHECFFRVGSTLGWEHSVPSFGHQAVAPGTSPTSWYTTLENLQHIVYVGTDQQLHECFYRIGGDNRWEHNFPSAGRALVAPGTSPTSWYTEADKVHHIAYVGVDQQIHECFFRVGSTVGWEHNVPSAGRPLVAPGTSPTSWVTTPENVQHIAYIGTDQRIHECFFRIGGPFGWQHNVTNGGHTPAALDASPTSWYSTPENVQHIAYVGVDRQIHECFFRIGGTLGWQHNLPAAGQTLVAGGTSPTSWYTTPEHVLHVAYVGTDQAVHECFFFVAE